MCNSLQEKENEREGKGQMEKGIESKKMKGKIKKREMKERNGTHT